jgi:hypothetical protein
MKKKGKPGLFTLVLVISICVILSSLAAQEFVPQKSLSKGNAITSRVDDAFINVNNIKMFVTNFGSIANDKANENYGFYFPKESARQVIYEAGLSVGAIVDGDLRMAVARFDQEFGPGTIEGGNPSDPDDPRFRIYKISIGDGPGTTDWDEWPFGDGAPDDGLGNPKLFGDQTLWSVFNDADPGLHNSDRGSTVQLGIEVQQTIFAYRWPATQANTIYVKYKIINKGGNTLQNTYLHFWHDPDLGDWYNDYAGFDAGLGMGYIYNAERYDNGYEAVQPAYGCLMLQGPEADVGGRLEASSFNTFCNSGNRQPDNADEMYNVMQGFNADGTDIIDPTSGMPTKFMFSGDPLVASGWLDEYYEDKQIAINCGPFTMAPGDTQEVIYAMMIGQGRDHMNSIEELKLMVPDVKDMYNTGFPDPAPPTADAAAVHIHQPKNGTPLRDLIPSGTVSHLGSGTESFNVDYIISFEGVQEYLSSRTTAALSPGQIEYIEFDNWMPPAPGIYDVEMAVTLTGDADNSNDIMSMQLEVSNPPAPNRLQLVSRGTGEAVLIWEPPDGYTDIVGYNIYRSLNSGGPYDKLNSGFITELSYTDNTIPNDLVYYAVSYENSTAMESDYSDELLVYPEMVVSNEKILLVNGVLWETYGQSIIDFYEKQMAGTYKFDFWDLFTENPIGFSPLGEGQAPPWDLFQQYRSVIWIGNNWSGDTDLWFESLTALKQYMLSGGNLLLSTRRAANFFDGILRTNYAHINNWSNDLTIGESNPLVAIVPGLINMGSGNGSTESNLAHMFMESSDPLPVNIATFTPSFEFDDLEGTIWKAGFRSELAGGGQFVFISGRPYRFDENASRRNYNHILGEWFGHNWVRQSEINANQWRALLQNDGRYMNDPFNNQPAGIYPKETNIPIVYSAGHLIGTIINEEPVVRQADYISEFRPGKIKNEMPDYIHELDPENPLAEKNRVYVIDSTRTGDDWDNWPVDDGAPVDDHGPLLISQQDSWTIYNDVDHGNPDGCLGVEIQRSTYSFTNPEQADVVYVKWKMTNKSLRSYPNTYFGTWFDPDLDDHRNDFSGYDSTLNLAFCYNGDDRDVPRAFGVWFIKGPIADGHESGVSSFTVYPGDQNPGDDGERYNWLKGLDRMGNTKPFGPYDFAGDPLTNIGHLDFELADKRMLLSSGPFTFYSGNTQEIEAACIGAVGADRLDALANLLEKIRHLQELYYRPTVRLSKTKGVSTEKTPVRISLNNVQGLTGGDFKIEYDNSILKLKEDWVTLSPSTVNFEFSVNVDQNNGQVSIALASSESLHENETAVLLRLPFKVKKDVTTGSISNLFFTEALLTIQNDALKTIVPAMENGQVEVVENIQYGDVNQNGLLDISDAVLILKTVVELYDEVTPFQELLADANEDDLVNTIDALYVLDELVLNKINTAGKTILAKQSSGHEVQNNMNVYLPAVKGETGQVIKIPVRTDDSVDLVGMELALHYNKEFLHLESVLKSGDSDLLVSNCKKAGRVHLAVINKDGVGNENGDLIYLEFKVLQAGEYTVTVDKSNGVRLADYLAGFLPQEFMLSQNYPNPFNAVTTIKYQLPEPANVKLQIFNIRGQLVETIINENQEAGYYTRKWKAENLSSGIYFYRIKAGTFVAIKKLILLK